MTTTQHTPEQQYDDMAKRFIELRREHDELLSALRSALATIERAHRIEYKTIIAMNCTGTNKDSAEYSSAMLSLSVYQDAIEQARAALAKAQGKE